MQSKMRPSPALVVSFIALLVALSGTAIAAKVLITSSSQIKNGTIKGVDIKKGTITEKQLSKGVLDVTNSRVSGSALTTGLEARRKYGPELARPGGSSKVVELTIPAGAYAIFAKLNVTPNSDDGGLLHEVLKDEKVYAAECTLDVGGAVDFAIQQIQGLGSLTPATLNMQITRTVGTPTNAVLTCKSDTSWRAENASIIAVPVGSVQLTDTK